MTAARCVGTMGLIVGLLALGRSVASASPQESSPTSLDQRALECVLRLGGDERDDAQWELEELLGETGLRLEEGRLTPEGATARLFASLALDEGREDGFHRETARVALRRLLASPRASQLRGDVLQLAEALLMAGRLAAAHRVAGLGVDERWFRGNSLSRPRLHLVRSEVARRHGRWDEVRAELDEMRRWILTDEQLVESGNAHHISEVRATRADLLGAHAKTLIELGLLDRVHAVLAAAAEQADRSDLPRPQAAVRLIEIDVAMQTDDLAGAARLAREAGANLAFAELGSGTRSLFLCAQGIAEAALERRAIVAGQPIPGDSPAQARLALALEEDSLPIPERLLVLIELADLRLARGELERASESLVACGDLLARLHDLEGSHPVREEALLAAHHWNWTVRSTSDAERRRDAYERLVRGYELLLEQWGATPRRAGGIGFLYLQWRGHVLGTLIEATRAIDPEAGDRRALAFALEAQAMGTWARTTAAEPGDLGAIRSTLLTPRRGLLFFVPARDGSHLFVVDEEGLSVVPVLARHELQELAKPVLRALRRTRGDVGAPDRRALERMANALLPAEVRPRIARWEELWVVGLDLVDGLPLEVLPWTEGERITTVGRRFAVSTLPSIPFGLAAAPRTAGSSVAAQALDLLLVVQPRPPEGLGLEPLTIDEADQGRLLAPFAEDRRSLWPGHRTSVEALCEQGASLVGVRVLHFLCHGDEDFTRERGASLVLGSRDGSGRSRLFAEDVERLRLSGVVLLSTCGAGTGPARFGDDQLAHLGGAFLEAGASAVVLAPQRVELEATLALMERVHRRLAVGVSPSEALRAAREATGGDAFEAYRRAAFTVIGRGFDAPIASRARAANGSLGR